MRSRAGPKGQAAISSEDEQLRQAGEIDKGLGRVRVQHSTWPRGAQVEPCEMVHSPKASGKDEE